ncbi:hypothetical protein [Marinobacter confluentis]|uniref:Uncharacterized protein n=1 Tax=Marinobacter confluentis TaxID=1697557 RepID=A0A4Z1CGM8_9GAMM|nr:hypothetical protein [Marinobacter confluentis]TGN39404.1 hypothetical protein E5Q11_12290 [Marinobacter confluentis]
MRHLRHTALLTITTFFIIGCGPDSPSDSKRLNPAASVSTSFESFTVEDHGGMPFLSRTIFFDFYQGLEAAEGEDDKGLASQLRTRLNVLMGLTQSDEDPTTYVAARNPFDLLHYLINTDQIATFNDGKRLMRDSLESGSPENYNTPANNAIIRFTELAGEDGSGPGPDQVWIYPLLDWKTNFSQLEPRTSVVFRSAQFIARPPEEDDENPAEIQSAFWSGRFDGDNFSATGYNRPNASNFNATGRNFGNVDFFKILTGSEYDTLFLNETSGITIEGEEPVFICAQIDYSRDEVRVAYITDPEADTRGTNADPSQCPNVGSTFTYSSEPVTQRQ